MKNHLKATTIFAAMAVSVAAVSMFSCNKSSEAVESEKVSLYLTDDPALYSNVFVDVKYVEVKVQEGYKTVEHRDDKDDDDHFDDNDKDADNDNTSKDKYGKWDTLSIRSGVYDILKLRNGVDTIFGQGHVKGRVRKVRITLGDKNSVVLSGTSYPLYLLQGANKYVYVKINNRHHDVLGVRHYGYWLDFNLTNSIIEQGGRFYLKPEIKPFANLHFGQVSGKVYPEDARAVVAIYNTVNAGVAIADKSGDFKIRGLIEGTYKITFRGANGYKDTTLNDVKIIKSKETRIPEIRLRK